MSWVKHRWTRRTAWSEIDKCEYECLCPWYTRLWFLVTGR